MRKDVDFFLRNEAEQFAQFILQIYQRVQERCFPFSNKSRYGVKTGIILSLDLVLKIFIRILVTENWSDFSSERLTEQASNAYNIIGMHLDFIKCITTPADAILPILPKIALKLLCVIIISFLSAE